MPRSPLALFALAALWTAPDVGAAGAPAPAVPQFNADIRPLFKAYCTECHGEADKPKGGLDLRLQRFTLQGGNSGATVVPGKPDGSYLIERVVSGDMPPGKAKLSAAEIDLLRRWIATGAKVETVEPATLAAGFQISRDDRNYWAFQPVKRPAVPPSSASSPIDAFLLAKLKEKGLSFAPPASKVALVRRLYFDLIGLPPTPEQVATFVNDRSLGAYERLVDQLLASPQYGERWGRHWLDVAGYADSEGASPQDPVRADAWKYRDYVIRSINDDKPYNLFLTEQLAGDELVKPPYSELTAEKLDALIATGFLRMAPDGSGAPGADQKLARNDVLTDTVKITASAFLGVTVGCAQCHNHRYDPIPQTDFFRLRAAFEPAYDPTAWKPPQARHVSLYTAADKKKAAEIEAKAAALDKERLKKQQEFINATFEKELAKLPAEKQKEARAARDTPAAKRNAAQKKLMQQHPSLNVSSGSLYLYDRKAADALKAMTAEATAIRKTKPKEEFVRALTEVPGKVPPTRLHHRGDPDQPKEIVPPGGLAVLDDVLPLKVPAKPLATGTTGRRTALAQWLTDPRHPLTTRVLVNRVWMQHFGRGLVGTPGDFGKLGERPSHPELLDWLAAEFMANGWSLKALHKQIVMTTAFQQSSRRESAKEKVDPDNRLLGRFTLRRLDAEAVRDAMLATSGKIELRPFGPPVPVMEDDAGLIVIGMANRDGAMYKLGDESVPPGDESRRSVYVQVRRSKPLGVLSAFDVATVEPNCEMRTSSTATPQALLLLNNEFTLGQAEAFANRLRTEAGPDARSLVTRAWRLAYSQPPTPKELSGAVAFLQGATEAFRKQPYVPPAPPPASRAKKPAPKSAKPAEPPAPEMQALALFCQALLSSNRFLYVD